MPKWIWLTDPAYTTNFENNPANKLRKILLAGRILREMDSYLYGTMDQPNPTLPDSDPNKTPIQTWINPPVGSPACHLFVRSEIDNDATYNAKDIDLVLGVYAAPGPIPHVAFVGAHTRGYTDLEFWNNVQSTWGAALRDKIIDWFIKGDNTTAAAGATVASVSFQYLNPPSDRNRAFLFFLQTDANTTITTHPVPQPNGVASKIVATLKHT